MKKENNIKMKSIGVNQLQVMEIINAKLLMVGLAPAAHGGNRTGRVFTGDRSADFLFKCLFEVILQSINFQLIGAMDLF